MPQSSEQNQNHMPRVFPPIESKKKQLWYPIREDDNIIKGRRRL
jgi:hypothetical protein